MRIRKSVFIICIITILCLCGCSNSSKNSTFSIQFIDVGQGDSALVECDGHYMLIDGGEKTAGSKVYNTLESKGIQKLDILAISHLHSDHIGGLIQAMTYASKIGITISNTDYADTKVFRELNRELGTNETSIKIPHEGDKYELGSATVEIVDVGTEESNASLVMLVTYGKTRFLFTGDIEEAAQTRISDKYQNDSDEAFKIDLIKMPHHGSYTGTLYRFLRTFMPDYAVISVGKGNIYGHPDKDTLDLLDSKTWKPKVYRTDRDGDILVRSNGKEVSVETEK